MIITPASFQTPIDICNRGLDHVGARHIQSFTDGTQASTLCGSVYDKLRKAELRRNSWRFAIKKAALRALTANQTIYYTNSGLAPPYTPITGTLILTPSVWNATTTYMPGAIVQDTTVPTLFWTSKAQENVNNSPGEGTVWDQYFGPLSVDPYDHTTSYWAGELVYVVNPNTGAIIVYRSLINNNGDHRINPNYHTPWTMNEYNPGVTYNRDQVVQFQFMIYRSLVEQNTGNIPTSSSTWAACGPVSNPTMPLASGTFWLPIAGSVVSPIMDYPVGAGPVEEAESRNAYRLPSGYLREAPQDPKQGAISYLGAPSGMAYNDWLFEGHYITSRKGQMLMFRFVADFMNVSEMDDMYCEGLAARIGRELAEPLTQATDKATICQGIYKEVMGEARLINGIETGEVQPPEDDYIVCRA